jgi:hypothetical protein
VALPRKPAAAVAVNAPAGEEGRATPDYPFGTTFTGARKGASRCCCGVRAGDERAPAAAGRAGAGEGMRSGEGEVKQDLAMKTNLS